MNGKTTLKRLERTLGARRSAQDAFADYEQAKLDAMTDEHLLEVLRTLRDAAALGDVLKDERLERDALELLDAAELEP